MKTLEGHISRIDTVIFLAGQIFADGMTDALEEFIDDEFGQLEPFTKLLPLIEEGLYSERDLADELRCFCARERLFGFLFKASVPYTRRHGASGFDFSWGHYKSKWMYAETADEMVEKTLAFEAESIAEDKARETARVPS